MTHQTFPRATVMGILWTVLILATTPTGFSESTNDPKFDSPIISSNDPKPQFPYSLWKQGIKTGQATLLVTVDQDGFLLDWLVIEATHVDLVAKIDEAVPQWTFQPAMLNGVPVTGVQRIPIFFDVTHVDRLSQDDPATSRIQSSYLSYQERNRRSYRSRRKSLQLASANELDRYPEAVVQTKPLISQASLQRSLGSNVTFKFYIDTNGRVRMPTLHKVDGNVDSNAILAVNEAFSQWQFKPLTTKRRPVTFEVSQTFEFSSLYALTE